MEKIITWLTDPSKIGLLILLAILAALAIIVPRIAQATEPIKYDHNDLLTDLKIKDATNYIRGFVKRPTDKRYRDAEKRAKAIVEAAERAGVDYRALTITLQCESSFFWKIRDGALGEKGIGQLLGTARSYARRQGVDLSTEQGQIYGSALWLAHETKRCGGDVIRGLKAYQTGVCSGPKRRQKMYEEWVKNATNFNQKR